MTRPNYIPFRTVAPPRCRLDPVDLTEPYDYVRPFEKYDADSTVLSPVWEAIAEKKADRLCAYRESAHASRLKYPSRPIALFVLFTVPLRTVDGHAEELLTCTDPNMPHDSSILGEGTSDATSWLISISPRYWAWMFAEYETYRRFVNELRGEVASAVCSV